MPYLTDRFLEQHNITKPDYDYLMSFGQDLTRVFAEGTYDPIIGREKEIWTLAETVSKKGKNNVALLGDAGVGKTAIVEGLAQRMLKHQVPDNIAGMLLYALDPSSLISGDTANFEQRIKKVIDIVSNSGRKIMVFIDEFHVLKNLGGADTSGLDAMQILKPALARGRFTTIAATTNAEWQLYIAPDKPFARRFQVIHVGEPTPEETLTILRGLRQGLEAHHGVRIYDDALKASVRLSRRFIPARYLPDKAIDLVDQAAAHVKMTMDSLPEELNTKTQELYQLKIEIAALENEPEGTNKHRLDEAKKRHDTISAYLKKETKRWENEKQLMRNIQNIQKRVQDARRVIEQATANKDDEKVKDVTKDTLAPSLRQLDIARSVKHKFKYISPSVGPEIIRQIVSRLTNIPSNVLEQDQLQKLAVLKDDLHKHLIGQEGAVDSVVNTIRRNSTGLSDPGKPIGTFLFLGPTGVGKTELAKQLTREMFGSEENMFRLNMSEFMDEGSVTRIIGAPPGRSGYGKGGELTEYVKMHPYSLILLDEAEKANTKIWDLFLQVFDDGILSDSQGDVVSFKNTIIIMTSNIGDTEIIKGVNPRTHKLDDATMDFVKAKLRNNNAAAGGVGFRAEFLNRIQSIDPFLPLTRQEDVKIAGLKLQQLASRLMDNNSMTVTFDKGIEKIGEVLSRDGYYDLPRFIVNHMDEEDMRMGARPLNRLIEKFVEVPFADKMIKGDFRHGDTVMIGLQYPDGPKYVTDPKNPMIKRPIDPNVTFALVKRNDIPEEL